jgi:NAD(P)-dependent dehydrogenase (short-subunit alcohol dehydrogenase family)
MCAKRHFHIAHNSKQSWANFSLNLIWLEAKDRDATVKCVVVIINFALHWYTDRSCVFDKVVSVNTRGALLVIKYAAQSMIRIGNGGSIVNVSSQAALIALSGHVSYAASKAALDSITRVSALELGPHNIRVNSVNPTVVITRMTERYWGRPEIMEAFLAKMPLGRYARPDDIAGPIAFLLSEDSQMISGTTLPVDGGYTAC